MIYSKNFDYIFATSSRFGTGFLGFIISKIFRKKLALDIRDIFSDSLSSISLSKSIFIKPLIKIIHKLETLICSHAHWLNFVSPGFIEYEHLNAENIKPQVYTNGIDNIFIRNSKNKNIKTNKKNCLLITYAGNIGFGQGLEKTVVKIAQHYGEKVLFKLIGDGSAIKLINNEISRLSCNNIILIKPVSRKELLNYYNISDVLFLQLNDIDVFNKVLPSKIFDYGSFDKPILAGVSGVAKSFLEENLPYSFIYEPGNHKEAIKKIDQIINFDKSKINNQSFVKKFDRKIITDQMVNSFTRKLS